jgi:GAF domain-containing protein
LAGQRRQRLWRVIAKRAELPGQDGWAQAVCTACVQALGRVDAAILALRGSARAHEVLGASDVWATRLAESQYTMGEGPGVAAFVTGGPVLVPDVSVEHDRWPDFVPAALDAGYRAVAAIPLRLDGHAVGGLNLLYTETTTLPGWQVSLAQVVSDLAALGLVQERGDRRADRLAERTLTALNQLVRGPGCRVGRRHSLDVEPPRPEPRSPRMPNVAAGRSTRSPVLSRSAAWTRPTSPSSTAPTNRVSRDRCGLIRGQSQ